MRSSTALGWILKRAAWKKACWKTCERSVLGLSAFWRGFLIAWDGFEHRRACIRLHYGPSRVLGRSSRPVAVHLQDEHRLARMRGLVSWCARAWLFTSQAQIGAKSATADWWCPGEAGGGGQTSAIWAFLKCFPSPPLPPFFFLPQPPSSPGHQLWPQPPGCVRQQKSHSSSRADPFASQAVGSKYTMTKIRPSDKRR